MIFKTVLKYKIFEWCLETLVNKLVNNFQVFKLDGKRIMVRDLKPGMHLSTIILNLPGWSPVIFNDCRILNTTLLNSDGYGDLGHTFPNLWDVKFSCVTASGTGL